MQGAEQKGADIEKITYINLNNIYNIFNGSNSNFNIKIIQILQNDTFFLIIDFYMFVGKFRKINISKNEEVLNGDTVKYLDYKRIKDYLIHDFFGERQEDYNKLNASNKIISISNFTSCIW